MSQEGTRLSVILPHPQLAGLRCAGDKACRKAGFRLQVDMKWQTVDPMDQVSIIGFIQAVQMLYYSDAINERTSM